MAETRSGIFTVPEFSYRRKVLKLAPDAFVTINDAFSARVLAPLTTTGTQDIDIRGGMVSMSINAAINPPGANRASFEVIAPQYRGLHEDYYITLPNGTRVCIFTPMMEVKIYMKARYLESEFNYVPRYYPVFWGMITGIQEGYSGGSFTFSIQCEDLLCWWKYQKITLQSGKTDSFFGGTHPDRFPTIFQNASPWEVIYALFIDKFFVQVKNDGTEAFFNFLTPNFSNSGFQPSNVGLKETFGIFAKNVINYWNQRFGFGVANNGTLGQAVASLSNIPLEIYGMRGPVKFESIKDRLFVNMDDPKKSISEQTSLLADMDLDFGMFARVQPYGSFDLYGDGPEAQISSKLEIATTVCERVNMEFFVDVSGTFVFKPPFYNLDVASGDVPYYKIGPEDVINFNASFDSNAIINYLTVTGPIHQALANTQAIGLHVDFESIKRFGIRSEQITAAYGMNAEQLQMIAVAEMARRNGQAFTASVSIPLRPEMRLGYPVYIEHIDTFYYVTGMSHSVTFGSAATTDLSLQFKRERMFDDGTSGLLGSRQWDVLYGCVYRSKIPDIELKKTFDAEQAINDIDANSIGLKPPEQAVKEIANIIDKQKAQRDYGFFAGPGPLGYWKIDKAQAILSQDTIDNPGTASAISLNELVMITDTSVPYTDKLGYRHIGGFPYGANLVVLKNGTLVDVTNPIQAIDITVSKQLDASGIPSDSEVSDSNVATQDVPDAPQTAGTSQTPNQTPEATQAAYTAKVDQSRAKQDENKNPVSEQTQPYVIVIPPNSDQAAHMQVSYSPSSATPGKVPGSGHGATRDY